MTQDIRWHQRFSNYKKALIQLRDAVQLSHQRELTPLEKQGLIQSFEYTHELAWKTLKDFLQYRGSTEEIYGSKDASRQAFANGIISDGETWMSMVKSRNLTSHTYDEETVEKIVDVILGSYIFEFEKLEEKLESLKQEELNNS
ncbi:MAG: nucleotidyltransferase [Epsilonproteobacteria bacterium]|nr:nucleotidyltransferase [Campylobacterota bacterium]OIO15299.1 MAG: nucleotidyltransferase [Helicobacteraceae bacterium CG1_02_36_14]PIP10405.1 MAG: nucleotidyltransferase [Sulfurimonas sp. CG23_combo_of_CG06-09_8_20_14_all_36_33]PIS24978.1 MAG: nucleotidyltransferase [Sulfurimonas sp. CG08_land_8_20_14_0_20_36_33]PIU34147.1 MAG: nucleotidyltransferase [Sulfurimonas sp. CG07_land_8_20_14_0_80_36_56]PIV04981.1 MAG: nucleotidyltransferase [Sulfurimonas sp. CG03_land_8_20_14_0_80_36_25]PIV3545